MSSVSWADSYIGQLREIAGDRVLMFTGARGVVRDSVGRVLLIERSDNRRWALPGGAMELGESIADCAIREIYEETGITPLRVTPFALYTGPQYTNTNEWGHTYQLFVTAFLVHEWSGELVTMTDESTDAGFFAVDELPAPLTRSVRESLDDLAQFERTGQLVLK